MENIRDYITRFQEYKSGNYYYTQINSIRDIVKKVEDGQKVVLVENRVKSFSAFGMGGVFLIVWLIMFIIGLFQTPEIRMYFENVTFVLCGILIFGCVILGLWYLRTSFIILGSEGIVYKLRATKIRGYNWENIKLDFYNFSYVKSSEFNLVKIHIFMPNGDFIKVKPDTYTCKEIPMKKYSIQFTASGFHNLSLFISMFNIYYDFGKNKTVPYQKRSAVQVKKNVTPLKTTINTHMRVIDTWKDQLKDALREYRKGKYPFKKYSTRGQMENDFLRAKAFVLKGGLSIGTRIYIAFFVSFPIISIITMNTVTGMFDINQLLFLLIILFSVGLTPYSILFLILRCFLVINRSGVYYRRVIRRKFFSWDNVYKIQASTGKSYPNTIKKNAQVKVYLLTGKKTRFVSNTYKNKEFAKEVSLEMFFNLFDINFKLSK